MSLNKIVKRHQKSTNMYLAKEITKNKGKGVNRIDKPRPKKFNVT